MAYRGSQNGMRIYDELEEVPRSIVESGQKFIVLDPPEELLEHGSEVYAYNSPLILVVGAFIGKVILIALVGYVTVKILQQFGYIVRGREAQKIDENSVVLPDGTVIVRDPETGEWRMLKGPSITPIVWAIVAIGLITIAILIFFAYKKKEGKKHANHDQGNANKKAKEEQA